MSAPAAGDAAQPVVPDLPILTTKVALVSLDPSLEPAGADPEEVAKALQWQIEEHVSRQWRVAATVEYCADIARIPADCVPLVIVPDDPHLPGHGFHLDMGGRPCALVRNTPGQWPVYASHELIELLCDPTGLRTRPGPTLDPNSVDENRNPREVDFLVEVCDPVEESTYPHEGVLLSDFVFPSYYLGSEGEAPFSQKGTAQPLRLLQGGSISWQTRDTNEVVQALEKVDADREDSPRRPGDPSDSNPDGANPPLLDNDRLKFERLRADGESRGGSRVSRQTVGLRGKKPRPQGGSNTQIEIAPRQPNGTPTYGERVQADVALFIELAKNPPLEIEELIRTLKDAKTNPAALTVARPTPGPDLSPNDILDKAIAALEKDREAARLFGDDVFGANLASWLLHLIP